MLPVYSKYFQKNKMVMFQLFPCLNHYCLHGKDFFRASPQLINNLIAIGVEALFASSEKANLANHAEGATLLQVVVQCLHEVLNQKQMEVILTKCLERLRN